MKTEDFEKAKKIIEEINDYKYDIVNFKHLLEKLNTLGSTNNEQVNIQWIAEKLDNIGREYVPCIYTLSTNEVKYIKDLLIKGIEYNIKVSETKIDKAQKEFDSI